MKLSERRVTSITPEATAAIAFAKGVAGAERRVLESVGEATIRGKVVSENTQKIANAILAKALLEGKLPPGAPGRPSNESVELKYVECAYRYFDLLDRRISHPAQKVADELHLEVRQVERCAKKYKWLIGYFEEDRDRFRAWRLGASDEEFKDDILMQMRLRSGRSVTGGTQPEAVRLRKASHLVEKLRQELAELIGAPLDPPSAKTNRGSEKT